MEFFEEGKNCNVCSKKEKNVVSKLGIIICKECWKWEPISKVTSYPFQSPDIDKIDEKIFVGNEGVQRKQNILKALDITNILVVGSELTLFHPNSFIYYHIDIDDFYTENISKYFNISYEFIINSKGKVLIHCAAGISRSCTIAISYIMRKNGINFEEAFNFVKKKRRCANPNRGFVKQLREYENVLKNKPKF